ncbi:P pilus assembly/Cpx signaling pathway, periplasmic inhibitor/zinc-resistance associated protein [Okeanomitos corallinicola TIOX110]|uniref:P pilus assembly/Cpx signaling pathway, periplasmic inhibitor/zinc-resistance associated protein n=1 Tax=Okeanomitos corallinicola TIOX110 TaxID=3133117 RepID=A0ABZ2UUR1_9CYAN
MKVKTLSLIAAAFAVTLTATPFIAQAQEASPSRQPGKEYRQKGGWEKLGLTEAQKNKIMEIRGNARAEMQKVFTTEQKEQLRAMMQERRNEVSQGRKRGWKKNAFAELNLTEAQKTKMQEIKESSKQQMEAVLTPAQLKQLQEMKQNRELRRQQRNNK